MGPGPIISWCSTMGELPRMNEGQTRRVKRLIRRLCANHDSGFCLLLDDGDPCVCPQSITNALVCRYFKAAVLPADLELYGDVMGGMAAKPCAGCGQPFTPPKRNTIFCPGCAIKRVRKSKREWAAKNRVQGRKSRAEKA